MLGVVTGSVSPADSCEGNKPAANPIQSRFQPNARPFSEVLQCAALKRHRESSALRQLSAPPRSVGLSGCSLSLSLSLCFSLARSRRLSWSFLHQSLNHRQRWSYQLAVLCTRVQAQAKRDPENRRSPVIARILLVDLHSCISRARLKPETLNMWSLACPARE